MVRSPRQKRSKATVDAIIKAAAICVAEYGAAETSTRKIAQKAGVGVGSIYEYFEDKEMIYKAMFDRFVEDVVAIIEQMIPELTELDSRQAIRTLLLRMREFLLRDNELYLKLVRRSAALDMHANREPLMNVLSQLMMQYLMKNPEATKVRHIPAISYIFMHGGVYTVVNHLTDPNPPITFEELADSLGTMLHHYVAQEMLGTTECP